MKDERVVWYTNCVDYLKSAIENVDNSLGIDKTALRWSIELGRIDILTKVSCLSQNFCYPREGHLDDVYRIFRYLYKNLGKNPGRMAYYPMYEPTYDHVFEVVGRDLYAWKYLYPDAQEIIPRHIPEALGKYFVIKA